jgi:hypothetical protein
MLRKLWQGKWTGAAGPIEQRISSILLIGSTLTMIVVFLITAR